ncbi:MAG TPA: ATP-binding protein [Anaerolineales bacterium]|nr:ATP-binding protein [Anaerolineales bacterium]
MPSNPIARLIKPDPYEDFFRTLADSLDDAVLLLSADAERLIACNHAFLLLSGYARPEIEALSPADLFPDEAGQYGLTRLLETGAEGVGRLTEAPFRPREGAVLRVDLTARPVGAGHAFYLLTLRPSGARQLAEDREQLRREQLANLARMTDLLREGAASALPTALSLARSILRASTAGVYRVSPAAPDYLAQGSLPSEFPASLPAAALRPFRTSSHWALGQRPAHALQKAARVAGLEVLLTAPLGTSTAWVGVLVAGWKDPAGVPSDAPALMEVIASLCDAAIQIGQQKAGAAELQASLAKVEAEMQAPFEASGEAFLLVGEDLRILRANPAACGLLGYAQKEIEALPVRDVLVGPEDLLAALLEALGHDREAQRPRVTLHRRDGTPFLAQLRALPQHSPSSSRLLIVLNDLSERQAIEDRTETLAQRALLGEVTAIFAHEVRNPINNISTGVQLVASRLGRDHPQHEALERIQKECLRLNQLMGDVLAFARPLELRIEPLDLTDVLQRLLARWEPRFRQAGVTCHTAFAPGMPRAAADPRTLEQIIVNLITNALQAMPEGGTLSVTLKPAEATQGPMVELKIADTGPGIPPEVRERIFDPFFTTKKEGTGLGLAITRRILSAHKGTISLESYPDAGTVFTVQIPAAHPTPGSAP